jgi:uncharacterized protein YndB with AHSA1/START domain
VASEGGVTGRIAPGRVRTRATRIEVEIARTRRDFPALAGGLRAAARCLILRPVGVVEFEIERIVKAPIHEVFARLSDINGHNEWMPKKGSILRHTQQTSAGEPTVGTTFLDETTYGPTPGEIVEFHAPHSLTYHWWDRSKSGRLKVEGWPSYSLETAGDGTTLVRHHAKMHTYGMYRLATPIFRRIAVRERTATVDALRASFEPSG